MTNINRLNDSKVTSLIQTDAFKLSPDSSLQCSRVAQLKLFCQCPRRYSGGLHGFCSDQR